MYCSTCGSALPANLSFCNRCGAKTNAEKSEDLSNPSPYPESLIWAMVSVFVAGMGVTIGLMAVMKNIAGFSRGIMLVMTFLSFFMMFVIEAVFISMFMRGRKALELDDHRRTKNNATRELIEAQPLTLQEPVASVTEQETRAFEPVYRKQGSDQ